MRLPIRASHSFTNTWKWVTRLLVLSTVATTLGFGVAWGVHYFKIGYLRDDVDRIDSNLPRTFPDSFTPSAFSRYTFSPYGVLQSYFESPFNFSAIVDAVYPLANNHNTLEMDASLPTGSVTRAGAISYFRGIITSIAEEIILASDVLFGNTTVAAVLAATFLTTAPSLAPNAVVMQSGTGTTFTVGGSTAQYDITPTGVTPGSCTYISGNINAGGQLTSATCNPAPTSTNVPTTTGGFVQDGLNGNFAMLFSSPHNPGGFLWSPDTNDFVWQFVNQTYVFELRSRPLINVMCYYPTLVEYDYRGLPSVCISGVAPGLPGGAPILDGSGKIPPFYLPDFLTDLRFYGPWDPVLNIPALTNATCVPSNFSYYYIATQDANYTLGGNTEWQSGDWAICSNGTWTQIRTGRHVDVTFFNGRTNVVVPQRYDYNANIIDMGNNYTLDVLAGYGFVMYTDSPGLPTGLKLTGVPGNIVVANATVDLSPVNGGMPLPLNLFPGFACNLEVDMYGRTIYVGVCDPLGGLFAGTNILITGTGNRTVSLAPDIVLTSVSASWFVAVGGWTIVALGNGTATIPNVGSADFLMTQGAQTKSGVLSFNSAPVLRSGVGMDWNNAGNTARMRILAALTLATDLDFYFPDSYGSILQVLGTDAGGNFVWRSVVNSLGVNGPNLILNGTTGNLQLSMNSALSLVSATFSGAVSANSVSATTVSATTVTGSTQVCVGGVCLISVGGLYNLSVPAVAPVAGQSLIATSASSAVWGYPGGAYGVFPQMIFRNTALRNVPLGAGGAGNFYSIFGTGVGSLTIPANTLVQGTTIEAMATGRISSQVGNNFQCRVTLGGVVLDTTPAIAASLTNSGWHIMVTTTVYSVAAGNANVMAEITLYRGGPSAQTATSVTTTTASVPVAVSNLFGIDCFWATANVANGFDIMTAIVKLTP